MRIEFRDSQGSFHYFEIKKGEATIGRSKKCDIALPYDSLSRTHARIDILEGDDATVTDLGSSNGTFLNDSRIDPNIPESFSSLFSFTLGDGIQMRLMEESEELPVGNELVIIRDEQKRPGHKSGTRTSQTNIRTQMVGARRGQKSKKSGRKSKKIEVESKTSKKGANSILRIVIILLCAAAVYLYLSDQ